MELRGARELGWPPKAEGRRRKLACVHTTSDEFDRFHMYFFGSSRNENQRDRARTLRLGAYRAHGCLRHRVEGTRGTKQPGKRQGCVAVGTVAGRSTDTFFVSTPRFEKKKRKQHPGGSKRAWSGSDLSCCSVSRAKGSESFRQQGKGQKQTQRSCTPTHLACSLELTLSSCVCGEYPPFFFLLSPQTRPKLGQLSLSLSLSPFLRLSGKVLRVKHYAVAVPTAERTSLGCAAAMLGAEALGRGRTSEKRGDVTKIEPLI